MAEVDLHAALEAERALSQGNPRRLLERRTAPLTIENGRLFGPNWDESYVDIQSVVTPEAFNRLVASGKLVFEDSTPTAFAARIHGTDYLLISAGLIELIGFCSYHVTVCGRAALQIGENLNELEDHFFEIVVNFVEHNWPLMEDVEATCLNTYKTMVINRDCIVLFVLLHELGHIACGHLDGNWLGMRDFSSLVPDLDTPSHAREIEADRFACDAIVNGHVLYLASTFLSAWTKVQVSRRVRHGEGAQLSVTHPLAVNRLHRISVLLRERQDPNSAGDARGLEADLKRCAEMMSQPEWFGFHAVEYSLLDGRARHDALLARYSAITGPFR